MYLILGLSILLFILGLAENARHKRNLDTIPVRILVNGTRGKSGVTRLIAGALREAGITTFAKTTGSEARIILPDGSEIPVNRPFGARLSEQKEFTRRAVAGQARAIVVECMAVRPESQMVMRTHFVRPTIGVITNVRIDHVEEMGSSLAETAAALALSVPPDGILVTGSPWFSGLAKRVVLTDPVPENSRVAEDFPQPEFAENVETALAVTRELGIDRLIALEGMRKARPDIGALGIFELGSGSDRIIFVNGFAANDRQSTLAVWRKACAHVPQGLPLVLLFNNRSDREYRVREFLPLLKEITGTCCVSVIGDNQEKIVRLFSGNGLPVSGGGHGQGFDSFLLSLREKAGGDFILFGIGNIQGAGKGLVEHFRICGKMPDSSVEGQCCRNP